MDQNIETPSWHRKVIGMQILIEGLAMGILTDMSVGVRNPLVRRALRLVTRDEARHAAFGVLSLRQELAAMTEEQRDELEDWTWKCLELVANNLLMGTLDHLAPRYGLDSRQLADVVFRTARFWDGRYHLFNHNVIPNLKRLGLVTARTQANYDRSGSGTRWRRSARSRRPPKHGTKRVIEARSPRTGPAMRSTSNDDLLHGSAPRALIRLALPMVAGLLLVGTHGVVNAYFVGRLGAGPLSAMSFAVPLAILVTNVLMGYGVGVTSVVARARGRDDLASVGGYARVGLGLAAGLAGLLALIGWLAGARIGVLLGADAEVLPYFVEYLAYWLPGLPCFGATLAGTAALRGVGETRSSGAILLLAAIVNLALDPLLIFGLGPVPSLGIGGAALATSLSYVVAFGVTLSVLSRRAGLFAIPAAASERFAETCLAIVAIGAAAIANYVMMPLLAALITALLGRRCAAHRSPSF